MIQNGELALMLGLGLGWFDQAEVFVPIKQHIIQFSFALGCQHIIFVG